MASRPVTNADQLRSAFTGFFADRGHAPVPSASLIPHDPSVLFTIAGMVPFKPFFLGDETPPWTRATSVQKCFRTVDIDVVGTTLRHCTFFEMLGNFSFGDYFKPEAIPFAWELVTDVLGIDGDRLWVTVYETDDEAEQIWRDQVGVPADRIQRLGEDNFWKMGDTGPCGPSSEIFFDKGPSYGADGGPAFGGSERFVEIWNLVFMQYNRDQDGTTADLPRPSIDTGAGLERILPVLQGGGLDLRHRSVRSDDRDGPVDHRTDLWRRRTGRRGLAHSGRPRPGHVHAGGRRRAAGQRRPRVCAPTDHPPCGATGPTAGCRGSHHPPSGPTPAVSILGAPYPALAEQHRLVTDVVAREEEGFLRTLATGSTILEEQLASGVGTVPGEVAFRLHDTYGFPVELTVEIAEEAGVAVDLEGFEAAMDRQRSQARAAAQAGKTPAGEQAYRQVLDDEGTTVFVGQRPDGYSAPARVVAVLEDLDPDHAGQEIFLDRTPFYAEGGGQDGDTGTIVTETGTALVYDTVSALPGLTSHRARVTGALFAGQDALATIDGVRRDALRRNHTGTHLLHAALRNVLGDHVPPTGVAGGTGPAPVRLQPSWQRGPRGAGRGGRHGQRRRPHRCRRDRGGDIQSPGRGHGRPGVLRGQVRGAGEGGAGRTPLDRAVRGYPCRSTGDDRPDHRDLGGVDRFEHPQDLRDDRGQCLRTAFWRERVC